MTTAQRFLSLSILGVMAIVLAPMASAHGIGINLDLGLEGDAQVGKYTLNTEKRAEIKVKLDACRANNTTDETRRTCMDAVLKAYGIERVTVEHKDTVQISEEAHAALKACKENNDTTEEIKICIEAAAKQFNIDVREHMMGILKGVRARLGHKFKSEIEEKCGPRADTDTWRECAKNVKGEVKTVWRQHQPRIFRHLFRRNISGGVSAELRAELKACSEKDTAEAKRACILDVTAKIRAEMKAKTH